VLLELDPEMPTVKTPKIYLCVLNWNGKKHLEYCIPSILATEYLNYELIVVDNASVDDSVEFVQTQFPDVRIIQNTCNLAWAGGNNVGIRDALERGFDWIVLLNNDILLDPRWLTEAVFTASTDNNIGLIGFNVFGAFIRTPVEDFYAAQQVYAETEIEDVQNICGCALMVKLEVFRNIGMIDETFFLYGEEEDFEIRAIYAGYRMISINLPVWHYSEGSSKSIPLTSSYYALRNNLRIAIKWHQFGLLRAIRWLLANLRFSCSPFNKIDPQNAILRRMRPTNNPFINGWIVTKAFIWNLFNWTETIKIRGEEQKRIELHRTNRLLKNSEADVRRCEVQVP